MVSLVTVSLPTIMYPARSRLFSPNARGRCLRWRFLMILLQVKVIVVQKGIGNMKRIKAVLLTAEVQWNIVGIFFN